MNIKLWSLKLFILCCKVLLGERLMPCFTKSPSSIPYSDVNLASHLAHSPKWSPDSSTSEVTTLQLEFRDLSRSSFDNQFEVSLLYLNLYFNDSKTTFMLSSMKPSYVHRSSTLTQPIRSAPLIQFSILLRYVIQEGRYV